MRKETDSQREPDDLEFLLRAMLAEDAVLKKTKQRNNTASSGSKAIFGPAMKQILIAAAIEIVTSQCGKPAKFRPAEEDADLSSLQVKMVFRRMHKRHLMSIVRVTSDETEFSERGSIVCENMKQIKGNNGKCRKCFDKNEQENIDR